MLCYIFQNALRQQRFVREVTIQYNLCNEPWYTSNPSFSKTEHANAQNTMKQKKKNMNIETCHQV